MAYYYKNNNEALGHVIPIVVGLIFAFLVYLVMGDFLFSLAGSVLGLLGVHGYVTYITNRIRTTAAVLGGFFGAIVGGYAKFTSAVLGGLLSGDLACLFFMTGYVVLFGILIYNYLVSGKLIR
jgi:hypothetical protein